MLAVKSVQACCDDVATMIFDEIDTGISGRAAHKVGLKMSELSRGRQVLCVTHLAQIAAMADNHLLIEKATHPDGRTYTAVRRIVGEERKRELARIISGDDDELSLANAERLMNRGAV
jgi:DNA repair protein RecN (Recombination protein N)